MIPFSIALLLYVYFENQHRGASCVANMRAIAHALAKYKLENPAVALEGERWHECLLLAGLVSQEVLHCPADDRSDDSISYEVELPLVSASRNPPVYIREIRPNHGGCAHRLYADGHVLQVRPDAEEQ